MKVLFASAGHSPDMAACYLWRGLQDLLGPENVADAMYGASLRGLPEGMWAHDRPVKYRPEGHRTPLQGEDDFDLLVFTSTFLRDRDWDWLRAQKDRLRPGGKFVYYETLDAPTEWFVPPFPVDAVFKREIDPCVVYPFDHKPLSLLCSVPEEWFDDPLYGWTDQKIYDVIHVSNARETGSPVRWDSLTAPLLTRRKIQALISTSAVVQPATTYLHVARMFRLVICTPGGGCSADSSRCWETIAMGGVPLFVGQPCRPRWPWFTRDHVFWADAVADAPRVIEEALGSDLDALRLRLKEEALKNHTSRARAAQFVRMVEEDAWRGAPGPWRW